jgi:hypothetical protein
LRTKALQAQIYLAIPNKIWYIMCIESSVMEHFMPVVTTVDILPHLKPFGLPHSAGRKGIPEDPYFR